MPAAAPMPLFGRIAVEMGYLTPAQLEQSLRLQAHSDQRQNLGAILVSRGFLTLAQVRDILARQRDLENMRPAPAPRPEPPPFPASEPVEEMDASLLLRPHEDTVPPAAQAGTPRFAPSPPAPPAPPAPRPPRGIPVARPAAARVPPAPPAAEIEPLPGLPTLPPLPRSRFAPAPVPEPRADEAPARVPPRPASAAPAPRPQEPPPPVAAPPRAPAEPAPAPEAAEESDALGRLELSGPAPTAADPRLAAILHAAEKKGASDVHFHTGAPPMLRLAAGLVPVTHPPLGLADAERLLLPLVDAAQRRRLDRTGDLDFAWVTPGGLRTRVNIYRTHAGLDGTFRLVRRTAPSLAELGLPRELARFTTWHQGLVLVTGPAGCGKTTTLAALVSLINEEASEHVLTFEDPIEIVHPAKRALVNQRQVGRDTESFARALRGALREDPDVMVVGELRDRETISLAVTAAETGHLVLGSMHTASAARTVARLLDAFPPSQQTQVRTMLSESLRGVISQRLMPRKDGAGRVAALEVLVVTPAIGNLIREGKLFQIRSAIQTGRKLGMCTLDDSVRELLAAGHVSREEASRYLDMAAPPPPHTTTPAPAAAPAAGATAPRS